MRASISLGRTTPVEVPILVSLSETIPISIMMPILAFCQEHTNSHRAAEVHQSPGISSHFRQTSSPPGRCETQKRRYCLIVDSPQLQSYQRTGERVILCLMNKNSN